MPNIEALRYLIELSKTNSINIAANNLYVSKSAISASIKKLENELSTELITRTYRGITLTENGKKVVALSEKIMSLMNQISCIAWEDVPLKQLPIIHIYAAEFDLGTSILSLVNIFAEIFGQNNFKIHLVKEPFETIEKTAENPYHLGFYLSQAANFPPQALDETISYTPTATSYMHLLCSKNTKYLKKQEIISLNDILKLPLIAHENTNFINSLPLLIGKPNLKPNIVFIAPNQASYWQAIQEDLGVGFNLKSINHFHFLDNPNLRTYPIREKITYHIYLLFHKDFPKYELMKLQNLLK